MILDYFSVLPQYGQKTMNRFRQIALSAATLWFAACAGSFSGIVLTQLSFQVVHVGLPGASYEKAMALNDHGAVVGHAATSNNLIRAFIWTNGYIHELDPLSGDDRSIAYDINNAFWVIGYSDRTNESYDSSACRWDDGVATNLGTLGGRWSVATGMNNFDMIAGHAEPSNKTHDACVWVGTNKVDLWPYNDDYTGTVKNSWARDVNDDGWVVGKTHLYTGFGEAFRPFIWKDLNTNFAYDYDHEMDVLGTLGGWEGEAWSINERGQVTGWAETSNDLERHIFLVTPTNGTWKTPRPNTWATNVLMKDIGVLTGGTYAVGYAINDAGFIVGFSETAPGSNRHAVISDGDVLLDINDMIDTNSGWVLEEARDINNTGEICGFGQYSNETRAFLLVPETDYLRITHYTYTGATERLDVRWTAFTSNRYFTMEYTERIEVPSWSSVPPTGQWPVLYPSWQVTTGLLHGAASYRVRGSSFQ